VRLRNRVGTDPLPVRLHEDDGALPLNRAVIDDRALELAAVDFIGHPIAFSLRALVLTSPEVGLLRSEVLSVFAGLVRGAFEQVSQPDVLARGCCM
jgi:hypothetical protein